MGGTGSDEKNIGDDQPDHQNSVDPPYDDVPKVDDQAKDDDEENDGPDFRESDSKKFVESGRKKLSSPRCISNQRGVPDEEIKDPSDSLTQRTEEARGEGDHMGPLFHP